MNNKAIIIRSANDNAKVPSLLSRTLNKFRVKKLRTSLYRFWPTRFTKKYPSRLRSHKVSILKRRVRYIKRAEKYKFESEDDKNKRRKLFRKRARRYIQRIAKIWKLRKRAYRQVLVSHRKNFWTAAFSKRKHELVIIPKQLRINYAPNILTIGRSSFDLVTTHQFNKLISFSDLPVHFNLKKRRFLRFRAALYGVQHNDLCGYNLWFTMGFKKNISVPWGLYFHTPWVRKQYLAKINKVSWASYAFALRNSFRAVEQRNNFPKSDSLIFYLQSDFSIHLSDRCIWNLRRRFNSHFASRIYEDEMNFQISTYHTKWEFYDYRARAVTFWTADNSYFRDPTFYITSSDTTIVLSPRKRLMLKWRLFMVAKFHRSWCIFSSVKNMLTTNLKLDSLLYPLITCINKSFYVKLNMWLHVCSQRVPIFNFALFKHVYLNNAKLKIGLLHIFNLTQWLRRFLKWFFLIFPIRSFKLFSFIDKLCKANRTLNAGVMSNFFNNQKVGFTVKKSLKDLQIKWKLLCLNFSSTFKQWYYKRKSVWVKKNRFKWVNLYFKSHGYFRFRITRWREIRRGGYQRLRPLGFKQMLRLKRKKQPRRKYISLLKNFAEDGICRLIL